MMFRSLFSFGILTSIMVLPTAAHAYITPEELLYEDDFSLRFLDEPPSRREIQAAAARQAAESAARREAEQESAFGGSSSSASSITPVIDPADDDLHGAAPVEPTGDSTLTPEELRDQRALERIRDNAAQESYEAQLRALGMDETLHSGAPLSDTGPATWIVSFVVIAAMALTFKKVRSLEKR